MMERYVRFIVGHRGAVVITVLVVTVLLATQLRHVHLQIERSANMPQQHPYVQIQNRMSDLFGGQANLACVAAVTPPSWDVKRGT